MLDLTVFFDQPALLSQVEQDHPKIEADESTPHEPDAFSMNTNPVVSAIDSWARIGFSITVGTFNGVAILSIVLAYLFKLFS